MAIKLMPHSEKHEKNSSTAAAVMDPHPTVVKPTDLIGIAVEHVMKNRYRHLPVVDDDGYYLGIFGVKCLLRLVLPKAATMEKGLINLSFMDESIPQLRERLGDVENQPISTCMRTDVVRVQPDTPLVETLLNLYNSDCCVPVVEEESGKLAGMISYFDVGQRIIDG